MIVLNGGSYYPQSKDIDKEWISRIKKDDLIIFIPSATTRSQVEYYEFFRKQMLIYGLINVEYVDLYKDWKRVSDAKVIYIAGGNTYKLMDIMNKSGFSQYLIKEHKEKIIIGNSAGAVVLGKSIETSNDSDIIGLDNKKGLNIVDFSVCPHYNEDKKDRLNNLSKMLKHRVIGLTEKSGLIIDNDNKKEINCIEEFNGIRI
ncbi:Type 1 glutamine amidotransferase-like domain-containing protein [Abyssisolibacter fermentans]|uniref:Type 1 glutamine amidotransferase-like domain-containing protein n=1 Tax=Abyssisolibacter fermentans TaxID=1766203 RepID=UPI0008339FA5|nr:Type 1 glutamine amidotransferase-like domain-containing protein [Abyssisolibacter fermentans]